MRANKNYSHLALSGGGVKGIAYAGMFTAAYKYAMKWCNLAGVSAGAIAGALAGAGYNSRQIWEISSNFGFKKIKETVRYDDLPVVSQYREYLNRVKIRNESTVYDFLSMAGNGSRNTHVYNSDFPSCRISVLNSIITFCKQGYIFDGDYLEEWIYKLLLKKGIKTFGDLRTGICNNSNPCGYRVRMTGVDLNRTKVVVIPDDMSYYGIDPDKFEVAKGVRISTCVPFAFKPVKIERRIDNNIKEYNLVDGGVFDTFPFWLNENDKGITTTAFQISEKQNFFSIDTPLKIYQTIVSAVHDVGLPKKKPDPPDYLGKIDTTDVFFLDFDLDQKSMKYLYNSGYTSAEKLFKSMRK